MSANRFSITTVRLRHEPDVVLARQRARAIAGLVGFDGQDQVKFATGVSEIARNAFRYAGGGDVSFFLLAGSERQPRIVDDDSNSKNRRWWLMVRVTDKGKGIPHLQDVLDGSYVSSTGMGLGITGAKRLNDFFAIESNQGEGTTVDLGRRLPPTISRVTDADVSRIKDALQKGAPTDASEELEAQNREMIEMMDALTER